MSIHLSLAKVWATEEEKGRRMLKGGIKGKEEKKRKNLKMEDKNGSDERKNEENVGEERYKWK